MSWWQTAKVGDKVVVIDGDPAHDGSRLIVSKVHEITEVYFSDKKSYHGCRVFIDITDNPVDNSRWSAKCFRPAAPLDKRMDELRGLLDPENGPWGQRETAPEKVSE